jgi:hypothetical protein
MNPDYLADSLVKDVTVFVDKIKNIYNIAVLAKFSGKDTKQNIISADGETYYTRLPYKFGTDESG